MNYSELITGSRSFMDHFNKREYLKYCQAHQQDCAPLYAEILAEGTDTHTLAQSILSGLQADWARYSWLKRKTMLETDALFCVTYFLPCLPSQEEPTLRAFAEEFAALWNRSGIKRHTMQVTTMENMQSGFTRKVFGFTLKSGK